MRVQGAGDDAGEGRDPARTAAWLSVPASVLYTACRRCASCSSVSPTGRQTCQAASAVHTSTLAEAADRPVSTGASPGVAPMVGYRSTGFTRLGSDGLSALGASAEQPVPIRTASIVKHQGSDPDKGHHRGSWHVHESCARERPPESTLSCRRPIAIVDDRDEVPHDGS